MSKQWDEAEWADALRQADGDYETASLIMQDKEIRAGSREYDLPPRDPRPTQPLVEADDGSFGPEFIDDIP